MGNYDKYLGTIHFQAYSTHPKNGQVELYSHHVIILQLRNFAINKKIIAAKTGL